MSNKESHPIRNGTIAAITGGIALTFWPSLRDYLGEIFSEFGDLSISIWKWLLSPHEVSGWAVILLVGLSVPTFIKLASFFLRKKELGVEDLYKADYLYGVNWHWSYSAGSVVGLGARCPTCDSELVYADFIPNRFKPSHDHLEPKTTFFCEHCDLSKCTFRGSYGYAMSAVEREIRRKIRTNEWKDR